MQKYLVYSILLIFAFSTYQTVVAQTGPVVTNAGYGWAGNSINTVVFRKNSLASFGDTQYISYYDSNGYVAVGKRSLSSKKWVIKTTPFKGNISDAHNTISMMVDGAGYLHLSWDHHNNALRYCRSVSPGSLDFTEKMPMTGKHEDKLSYPEFYRMPNGNLLFFYRDGGSGQGNMVINAYDLKTQQWRQLQSNLIDGESKRNAYWQACVDAKGTIHISWVWRESPDVASNHDMCYAKSTDGGISWQKSTGEKYQVPINAATAEYVCHIPQKSELINQTSMYADEEGHPFIATYYREPRDSVPQYHLVYNITGSWSVNNTGFRKTAFSLSGMGTKRIPISRPQIVTWKNKTIHAAIIFRDEERGSKVSLAVCNDVKNNRWTVSDIGKQAVGSWEPSYDTELWKQKKRLHLFVQFTDQADSEGKTNIPAQAVITVELNHIVL